MICVLLGASFYFVFLCYMLFIILFFNKNFQQLPLGCLNCMFDVCCVKTETFDVVFEFSYFTGTWKVSEIFTQYCHVKFFSCPIFLEFLEVQKYTVFINYYRLFCLDRLLS